MYPKPADTPQIPFLLKSKMNLFHLIQHGEKETSPWIWAWLNPGHIAQYTLAGVASGEKERRTEGIPRGVEWRAKGRSQGAVGGKGHVRGRANDELLAPALTQGSRQASAAVAVWPEPPCALCPRPGPKTEVAHRARVGRGLAQSPRAGGKESPPPDTAFCDTVVGERTNLRWPND